ncbi:hypothetical protein K1719_041847 [Acacia pycnantha]|nr:hypothetical protein K1719_041847 [Acacia pycnantha]
MLYSTFLYTIVVGLCLVLFQALRDDFLKDKLKSFYKSDPVPENNDGDVKITLTRLSWMSLRMFSLRFMHPGAAIAKL